MNDENILITSNGKEEHFQIKNLKDEILLLQKVSTNQIMIFGNQTKFNNYAKLDIYDIAKRYYYEETKTFLK